MTHNEINEFIRNSGNPALNSIVADDSFVIRRYEYCHIEAYGERIEYKSSCRTAAIDHQIALQLKAVAEDDSDSPFTILDTALLDTMNNAPKAAGDSFLSLARNKMHELMNGGRRVNHHSITLLTDGDKIALSQPLFAIKRQCSAHICPDCNGSGTTEQSSPNGKSEQSDCPECKGRGYIGTLSYITPEVKEKRISMICCLKEEIDGLDSKILEKHKATDAKPIRMLTHFNGIDKENFDNGVVPYLDTIRDHIGEENAIEEIYYRIIPCLTFGCRNIITGETFRGVVVDSDENPEVVLLSNGSISIIKNIRKKVSDINIMFGDLNKGRNGIDKNDLRRSMRLMIAVVVADGNVSNEEKHMLHDTIDAIGLFTNKEKSELTRLLGSSNCDFLVDHDYHFKNGTTALDTLDKLRQFANADGEVHENENRIINKLSDACALIKM